MDDGLTWVYAHDGSAYVEWGAKVLEWSFHRINQPGRLVRIWASDKEPTPSSSHHTFRTNYYGFYDGSLYHMYNRICGVRDWLNSELVTGTVVLFDHDMIFMYPSNPETKSGYALTNPGWNFISQDVLEHPDWASRHVHDINTVKPIGSPMVFEASDLKTIHFDLAERTKKLRLDHHGGRESWIDEMYAMAFAVADLGIEVKVNTLAEHVGEIYPEGPAPLLHYAWVHSGFDKFNYKPWNRVPLPSIDAKESTKRFVKIFNTYVDEVGYI